ncbi:hypothetical protein Bbelb_272050 [Branchiostoma belcheri]|nr:hypothetical protein Bbelb_272050 [Branchiostoma belcheri]
MPRPCGTGRRDAVTRKYSPGQSRYINPNSVHDTLRNTDKLIETTKKAFPKARVAVSQVLQRGPNHKSPLNENIKTYNQEVLKLSKTSGFTYIKHRKLTQDRRLYLPDQLHLDPRSGTKLLVADVKRTLTSQTTPSAGPSQLPMARPEHEHRPFGQHAQPRYQPTNSRRDNAIPTRSWNRGQPFKNSANAVPLGTRNPLSQPAIGNQTAVNRATTSTITLRSPIASTKQAAGAAKPHGIGVRVNAAARSRPGIQPTVLYTMKGPHKYYLYGAYLAPCTWSWIPDERIKDRHRYYLYGALPGPQIKDRHRYYLYGALPGPQMKD